MRGSRRHWARVRSAISTAAKRRGWAFFFKEKRDIGQQLALWRHGDKLDRLTQRLVALHRELLTNSQAAELLLAQGLADIARVAVARAR